MTIPNFITIARLLGVPLIVWLMIADRFVEATVLFILAGLSDAADGFIAKRFGASSELGAYLDPVADKALLVSVFVTLGFKGLLPAWLIVLTVSRDFFIIGGMLLAYVLSNPMAVKPLWISKANTAAQILLIALVLGERSGVSVFQPFLAVLVLGVAGLTVGSAGAYLVEWVRHMAGGPGDAREGGR
ncbi:MAG TPA: CDP-alcohol phosphatidyltransferase family protein [Propylenella sp.]